MQTTDSKFRYFMHDGAEAFSFELAGDVTDAAARELDQVWRTASSVIGDRLLVVDISYLTGMGNRAVGLFGKWHGEGAQFVASTPASRALLSRITGRPVAAAAAPAKRSTWLPVGRAARAAVAALSIFVFAGQLSAAELKPETLKSWDEYVEAASCQLHERLSEEKTMLPSEEVAARLRNGEILVQPASPHIPMKVPSGLIHDWVGYAFIPNATLGDVLAVVRDYGHYKDIYHPAVIGSKTIASSDNEDRFSMLLMNKSLVSKTALDSDYLASYIRLSDQRWYSVAHTVRIQEIKNYGASGQRTLPQDEGTGLIWRAMSVTRFEERDGGVYVELEAMVLSRDVPAALHWMIDPIIRRVSRESLTLSLKQTQEAVESSTVIAKATRGARPVAQAAKAFR